MSAVDRSAGVTPVASQDESRVLESHARLRITGEIVIDGVRFTSSRYNQKSDILALHVDDERPAHQWWDRTPEWHMVRFALDGALQQVDLLSPRDQLERDGYVSITPREGGSTDRIAREAIEAQLIDTTWREEAFRLNGHR